MILTIKSRGKGQIALEFLTTYGWAFLVIIIMISALAYFGILDPSKLLPDRCNFGTEIGCADHLLDASGDNFRLRLKNNVGEIITVSGISLSSQTATSFTCSSFDSGNPSNWKSGNIEDLSWSGCTWSSAGFEPGSKAKIEVKITYNKVKSGASYPHDVHGEVLATVG